MKISTKGRYALRLMIDLAQNSNGKYVSLKDVSSRQGISVKYLEQIVGNLCKWGYVKSTRGAQGGYMLTKKPKLAMTSATPEILRITEGKLAPVACVDGTKEIDCERAADCLTLEFWKGLYRVINEYIDQYTLEDLLNQKTKGTMNCHNKR